MNDKRLATVVRIRALQERIARGEVARERAQVLAREQAEAAAHAAVARRADERPTAATAFVAHRQMLDAGVRQAGIAGEFSERARQGLVRSLDDWTVAAQRLDGVERLEERARSAAAEAAEHAERGELDDIVVMRWGGIDERSAS